MPKERYFASFFNKDSNSKNQGKTTNGKAAKVNSNTNFQKSKHMNSSRTSN